MNARIPANGTYTRTYGFGDRDEEGIIPRFYTESVQDLLATEREGRPIFRDEEHVELIMPGNPYNQPVMKVTDAERKRWPKQYGAFREGQDMAVTGTPLEQWSILKRSQVLELKALHFSTVEQVAAMSDMACQQFKMAGMRLRDQARAYLDEAAQLAITNQLAGENERKDAEIARLSAQVAEQGQLLERVHHQLQALQGMPNPIAAHVPGQHDPMEAMRMGAPRDEGAQSSLDDIAARAPRRRRAAAEGETAPAS